MISMILQQHALRTNGVKVTLETVVCERLVMLLAAG